MEDEEDREEDKAEKDFVSELHGNIPDEEINKDGNSITKSMAYQHKKYLILKSKAEEILKIKYGCNDKIQNIGKIIELVFNRFANNGRFILLKINCDDGKRDWDKLKSQNSLYDGKIIYALGGKGLGYQRFWRYKDDDWDNVKVGSYLDNNSQLSYINSYNGEFMLAYLRMLLEIDMNTIKSLKEEFTEEKYNKFVRFLSVLIANKDLLKVDANTYHVEHQLDKPLKITILEDAKLIKTIHTNLILDDNNLDTRFRTRDSDNDYKYSLIHIEDLVRVEQCFSILLDTYAKHKVEITRRANIIKKLSDDLEKEFEKEIVYEKLSEVKKDD